MASIPPNINKSKNKIPSSSNKKNKPNIKSPQSTKITNADIPITSADIYPYKSAQSQKTQYKNYNFVNMADNQISKSKNPLTRFSLTCNGYSFQAHIDPNHIINTQAKRIAQLDTLTGIVLQDYGYMAQTFEIRGTTGAAYFLEIQKLNDVFNNQSTSGTPTVCTLTLETITYSGVWKEFSFERQAQENTYKYTIGFTVMKLGKYTPASDGNFNSQITQSNTAKNAMNSSDGKSKVTQVSWAGKTPQSYVESISQYVPASKRSVALAYIKQNWSTASQNKARNYPGDRANLNTGEVLVIPLDWSTILNNTFVDAPNIL